MSRSSCVDYLCLCNPLWSDDDVDDDEVDANYLINLATDSDILLSARSDDDLFTLPATFDPMEDYYKSFNSLDTMSTNNAVVLSINDTLYNDVCNRLREGISEGYKSLNSDLSIFKISIKQHDKCDDDMIEKVKSYEYFMDKYDLYRKQDEEHAELYLENARNTINRYEARVKYYKQAIYYTHDMTKKLAVRKEYITFCKSITQCVT
jgi:hypothetical protein